MKKRLRPIICMIALLLASPVPGEPGESEDTVDVTMADIAFIEGRWHTELVTGPMYSCGATTSRDMTGSRSSG